MKAEVAPVETWRRLLNSGPCMREARSPMGNNTQSDSPSPLPPSGPTPKFAWPVLGIDPEAPRLPWADFLNLVALQAPTDYPGPVGRWLAARLGNLMAEALHLNAHSPEAHEHLAQAAADAEASWVASLEAEVEHPGIWVVAVQDENPRGTRRGYYTTDTNDETWVN